MFCRNKKFCSVKSRFPSCTFAVIQILDKIGSLPFISWAISMKLSDYFFSCPSKLSDYFFSCPSTDVPSFVEKYPKIKYGISDRPHWQLVELCETSFLLQNGSH
jgi:hypothetical protein